MHTHSSGFSAMVQYGAREEIKSWVFSTHLTRNMAGNRNEKKEGGKGVRNKEGEKGEKKYFPPENQASKTAINSTQYLLSHVKKGQSCLLRIITSVSAYS